MCRNKLAIYQANFDVVFNQNCFNFFPPQMLFCSFNYIFLFHKNPHGTPEQGGQMLQGIQIGHGAAGKKVVAISCQKGTIMVGVP